MSNKFIMQMRPYFGKEETNAIINYMEEDGFITEYQRTEKFEKTICEFTGAKHCIIVNNGTISLTLAAMSLNIKHGDEVIIPNYTMVATPNSVKMFGAKPVFVDIDKNTLCLDLNLIERAINKKTKAIIFVSANGRYPLSDIDKYTTLCKKYNIHLIEDAAQSLGSYYPDGIHIGRKGRIGSFSFSTPKIISTGQGGALITEDDEIALKIRRLKDFGRSRGGIDVHDSIGFNSKFTELQAVIGLEQMKKLQPRIKRKKDIWTLYKNNLADIKEIKLFNHDLKWTCPWFIDCVVENRSKLIEFLKKNNIGSRLMYPPLNEQKAYNIDGNFPVSKIIGEKGLWLPSYVQLSDNEINFITSKIYEFYR